MECGEVIMKKSFRLIFVSSIILLLSSNSFASESASTAYLEGCKAFSRGEWNSAVFLLKKAASYSENDNPDTHYMMISAEIYAGCSADIPAEVLICDLTAFYPDRLRSPAGNWAS